MAPQNLLVGIIALALLPLIAWRIFRGLRDGRLPLYRTHVTHEEGAGRFGAMLILHVLSFFLILVVAADLLLDLGLRSRL